MYVHVMASITTAGEADRKNALKRFEVITDILDKLGCQYNKGLIGVEKPVIPEDYLNRADKVAGQIEAMRDSGKKYTFREALGGYFWMMDEIDKSDVCIFDLTRSSAGIGFQLNHAVNERKTCLVLYDSENVSTIVLGVWSRYVLVRRWSDNVEEYIKDLLNRYESGLTNTVRFLVSDQMLNEVNEMVKERGVKNLSEYYRELIAADLKKFGKNR